MIRHKGDTEIDESQGAVYMVRHKGNTKIDESQGALHMQHHHGDSYLDSCLGALHIDHHRGPVYIVDPEGEMYVKSPRQAVHLESPENGVTVVRAMRDIGIFKCNGELRAHEPQGDVRIDSASGEVHLHEPAQKVEVVRPHKVVHIWEPDEDVHIHNNGKQVFVHRRRPGEDLRVLVEAEQEPCPPYSVKYEMPVFPETPPIRTQAAADIEVALENEDMRVAKDEPEPEEEEPQAITTPDRQSTLDLVREQSPIPYHTPDIRSTPPGTLKEDIKIGNNAIARVIRLPTPASLNKANEARREQIYAAGLSTQ